MIIDAYVELLADSSVAVDIDRLVGALNCQRIYIYIYILIKDR